MRYHRFAIPLLMLSLLVSVGFFLAASNPTPAPKYLIEWGWDTPFLQEMPAHIQQAQNLAFDGAIFDVQNPADPNGYGLSWYLFSNQPVDTALLAQVQADLAPLDWGRFNHNLLRVTVHPAEVDWFEDWTTLLNNLEVWAAFAQSLGFAGIMFDTEQYDKVTLFDYIERPQHADYTLADYSTQVRQRGGEVMQALERGYPNLTVLFTFGIASAPTGRPAEYDLLPAFVDGMQTARTSATLIDGYERSYLYLHEADFLLARQQIEPTGLDAGFGLWLDPVCCSGGLPVTGCGFTIEQFRASLTSALAQSDGYVWVYSEDIDWYTGYGIPAEWWALMDEFKDR